MPKKIFTEDKTDVLVMFIDPALMDDSKLVDCIDRVLDEISMKLDNGEAVFTSAERGNGYIDFRFRALQPLRVVTIWSNRIKKMMQDTQPTAAV